MDTSARRSPSARLPHALALALITLFVASLPASAFSGNWTTPKRVFSHDYAPSHSMASDAGGAVHIATERGATGVWYVTNKSGSWKECQVSTANDRQPSIGLDGDVVHIAFARRTAGQEGIYTASSDQATPGPGCGWAVALRHAEAVSHPSLGVRAGTLSIAFRTDAKKLKFVKGPATASTWTIKETIDGKCCTSPVDLALTTNGAPRVAYGDGTSKAEGLKYGVRGSSGWKKTKARKGRVKHVALALDRTPGLFGAPPSNSPSIAFVVKKKGLYHASKGGSGVSGKWTLSHLGKAFGPTDINVGSNLTLIAYVKNGNLWTYRHSGGIRYGEKLSGSGIDSKPQMHGSNLTFTRKNAATGIYYTRKK